jgi:hypothetical protein
LSIPKNPDLAAPGSIEVDATDPVPKPTEFTANTLNAAAELPMAGTNADVLLPATEVVQVPTPPSITYWVTGVFPSVAGVDHETVNPPSAGTTETFCG